MHEVKSLLAKSQLASSLNGSLEVARNRLVMSAICFSFALAMIAFRLLNVMVLNPVGEPLVSHGQSKFHLGRADIVDRHGEVLATSITTSSLYANAQKVLNAPEAVHRLAQVLPKLNKTKLIERLKSGKRFVWIARHLTPTQREHILSLGLPGFSFMRDQRRIYPYGNLVSHVVGLTDIDNNGIGGVEKTKDDFLRTGAQPLELAIDLKIQHVVYDVLKKGMDEFLATGAAAILMDLETEEILGMVSLPDFNPNKAVDVNGKEFFNKATLGMYEFGSTMKVVNTAMVLESGVASLKSTFDTSAPLQVGRFSITDYRANHGVINVAQILVYSSNRGSARMALAAGTERQKKFLEKLGYLSPNTIELPEHGRPIVPKHWRDVNTMTIAYGYGLAISPSHQINGMSSIIGGGCRKQGTLLKKSPLNQSTPCNRVVSESVSKTMLQLMRFVVTHGTSTKANKEGYFIAGKTGTRNMLVNGSYRKDKVATAFVGILGENQDKPKYIVVVLLEDPKPIKKTFGFTTAGWNAAEIGGNILARVAAVVGLKPTPEPDRIVDPFFKTVTFKAH
jgi:cell division protein FtsI (penicillin-binding protein 3)